MCRVNHLLKTNHGGVRLDLPPSRRRVKLRGKKKLQQPEVKVGEEERVRAERASVLADGGRTEGVNDGRKERTNGRGSLPPAAAAVAAAGVFFAKEFPPFLFTKEVISPELTV